jgi:hypothetical protein
MTTLHPGLELANVRLLKLTALHERLILGACGCWPTRAGNRWSSRDA